MYDSNSKGISYTAGFFILIAFTIAGVFLSSSLALPVWTSMTGASKEALIKGQFTPAHSSALKVIQIISAVVGFLLPAIVAAFMLHRKPFDLLGFSQDVRPRQAGIVIVIILVALFVSFSFSWFNREIPLPTDWKIRADKLEADYNKQLNVIIDLKNTGDYILALIIMALLPAICEEALFRGGLQNFLTRGTNNPWLSIIVVSLIFSAVHFSYYGFLPRLFLGGVLGLIFHYSGKLWLSILAHFINNALAITALYAAIRQGTSAKDAINESNGTWWGIFAFPLLVLLFIYFKRISFPNRERTV